MKIKLVLVFSVFNLSSYCQTKDSLIIEKRIYDDLICDFRFVHSSAFQDTPTTQDSFIHCLNIIVFTTNVKKTEYQKEYNLNDTLVAEGPLIRVYHRIKFYQRKRFFHVKKGLWKIYDYTKKEIRYVEYEYRDYQETHNLLKTEKMQ